MRIHIYDRDYFNDKNFIAEQIKKHRKKAGLTQAELAEKVNLSTQHISRIESACYIPSLSSFFMIVEVLHIDLKIFGFDISSSNNFRKDSLIQTIAKSNETELVFYENAIKAINDSLNQCHRKLL